MSTSGLHTFLQGTTPQMATVRKITAWYFRMAGRRGESPSTDLVSAALAVLLQPFPAARHPEVRRELAEVLARRCDEMNLPQPAWLVELRRQSES